MKELREKMTLYKQLLIAVSVIFALLLSVLYWMEFDSAKDSLVSEQKANVINTSNSLGLALTPYLDSGDRVGAESAIKAVFDGGYYYKIRLELYSDNQIIESINPKHIRGVPEWFTSLDLFPAAVHEQILTSGWLQLGKITVEGHQGHVYKKLWRSMSDQLTVFLIGYLLTLIVLIRALTFLLRPLYQIKKQVVEIQHRQAGHRIELPKAQELKELVIAFNLMSSKLAQQFKELASEAEGLRRDAYQDAVSGLGNRAYFVSQVNSWVAEGGRGGIVLLSVDILDIVYRDEGFAARDDLVKSVAEKLKAEVHYLESSALARISLSEFAILLPGLEGEELQVMGSKLNEIISDLVINPMGAVPNVCAVGLAQRRSGEEVGELLTMADNALQTARKNVNGSTVLAASSYHDRSMGRLGWKSLVRSAIDEHSMKFKVQPVHLLNSDKALHVELFASIHLKGTQYHAGQFLPAIEQFKLGKLFDRYILEQVIMWLDGDGLNKVAVNLTNSALKDPDFRTWFVQFLNDNKKYAELIAFELPESALVDCSEAIQELCSSIRDFGFSFGVDQYGRHIQSLEYLAKLRPNYVKIDFGYTAQVLQDQADPQMLMAICKVAHNLKILTIAQRVETHEQKEALSELIIDGYQGFLDPPVALN